MAILTKPQYNHTNETGMEHVKNLLQYGTNFSIYNSTANDSTISYFENLADFLRDQEQNFYDALGVGNIAGLNLLLKQINTTKNLSVLDAGGAIMQEISNRFVFKDKSKSEEQQAQKQEQDIFSLLNQLLQDFDANSFISRYEDGWTSEKAQIFNACTDALTEVFNNLEIGNGLITYRFTAYGQGKSSFTGYYASKKELAKAKVVILNLNTLFAKGKKGKITIQDNHFHIEADSQALTDSLQAEFRNRIRPALEEYLNVSYEDKRLLENMPKEQIRDEILKVIREKIDLDADDLNAAKKIEIGAGKGNISGFLGELQSRLYFKSLFSSITDTEIIDKGASFVKSLGGSGQMDPTDTQIRILNHLFNIQVKNYSKGGAEWSGNSDKKIMQTIGGEKKISDWSSAKSFMLNRLQINDSALMNFFGAATWHNLNPEYSDDPKYGEYSALYGEFQSVFNSLKESFDTFLPNIIRLTAILDGLEDLSYENFYFQKGTMIPASAIVDCILDALLGARKNVYTSSYAMYPGKSHFTYQHPFEDNYGQYADETIISWKVTVNFSTVLHSLGL